MKIREQIVNIVSVGIVLLLVSCATIVNDPNIPLVFSFSDGSSGECTFKNKRGVWSSEIPTTEVMIRRSDDALVYDCLTEDGKKVTGSISSEIEGEKLGASIVFLDFGITDAITDKHRTYQRTVVIPVPAEKDVAQTSSLVSNEENGVKLASIPKDVSGPRVTLREEPIDNMSADDINDMVLKYGFFEASNQSSASFTTTLVDTHVGTVTDITTGLMWQKSGSSRSLNHARAKKYILSLNEGLFAGYSDWRMPTVEELASLLKKDKDNNLHISSVFDSQQKRCWSSDRAETMHGHENAITVWVIDFRSGEAKRANWYERSRSMGAKSYTVFPNNYVKAVRSVSK